MRHLALYFCGLLASVSFSPVMAAGPSPSASTIVVNFAVVPGKPLVLHQKPQFAFNIIATPGQVVHELAAVANGSKTTSLTATLSTSDARTPAIGAGLEYVDSGAQYQIGRWTQLNTITVTVPPGEAMLVPITVSVPAGARPGDYEGALDATTTYGINVTQGQTRTAYRFTKRCLITLRVMGHASAGLRIVEARSVNDRQRRAALAITLKNTGTVIDRPATSVITFVGRHKTYTLRPLIGSITPSVSTTVGVDLSRTLPAGTYKATIVINYLAHTIYTAPPQHLQATWSGTVVVPASSGQ